MSFRNLVFSLFIISISLNANTDTQDPVSEYSEELVVAVEQSAANSKTLKEKLEVAINQASMLVLFSLMGTLLDIKEFSQKNPTLVATLAGMATYKLVKSRLQ